MFLRFGEASSQQPEMGDEEPCYFGCGRSFEVLGEAAASTEPGEGTFDDPAPRQELEALGALRSLDDFDGPRSAMGQCGDELIAAVNPVGKDMAKLGELEPQMFQQRYGSVDILDIGLVYAHGEQETIAYVLEGESYVRWGEHGEFDAIARAGDFIHVPAWLPHLEVNRSPDRPFRWIVVRSTATPIVVNLPDDYWG